MIFALMQSRVRQKASLMSKVRHFVKDKFAKRGHREADAMKDMCSQFAKAKPELLLRFGADDDKSAFTMVVWDFGGQRVSCAL